MVPAVSDGIPPVPPYSGSRFASFPFRLQAFHLLRGAFPGASARFRIATFAALLPRRGLDPRGLGSSAFARHYSRNHSCSLLLPLLRCFSSRRSPRSKRCEASPVRPSRFPFHIPVSRRGCSCSLFPVTSMNSLGLRRAPARLPPEPGLPAPRVRLVVPSGVEPLTPTLSVWCSDQLSYGTGLSNCSTLHVRNSKKRKE